MDRRDFLKKGGAVVAGGMLADFGIFDRAASAAAKIDQRPNIVVILVDEMRFPTAFPQGVHTPEQFLGQFMPNVHELWTRGVKFERYYSAGNACSPARATIATGLYPHQEWLLATRTAAGPALQPAFPTYGKLLRTFGYRTPYFGKWHLSNPPSNGSLRGYLENYGFQGFTTPDPTGTNGEGAAKDGPVIADKAVEWLQTASRHAAPSASPSASSTRTTSSSSGRARKGRPTSSCSSVNRSSRSRRATRPWRARTIQRRSATPRFRPTGSPMRI